MRAEIPRRDSEKVTPEAINYVTKEAADYWDKKFEEQITTKQVNRYIKDFQSRRKDSKQWKEARDFLKKFYAEDFRVTLSK